MDDVLANTFKQCDCIFGAKFLLANTTYFLFSLDLIIDLVIAGLLRF